MKLDTFITEKIDGIIVVAQLGKRFRLANTDGSNKRLTYHRKEKLSRVRQLAKALNIQLVYMKR